MERKVTNYTEIIYIYNTEGAKAACEFVRMQFGVKNPWCVLKRMKDGNKFHYDAERDRFLTDEPDAEPNPFLSLDELCQPSVMLPGTSTRVADSSIDLEVLIKNLLEERLLQLSKYVQLNQPAKKILVDRSSMLADGFEVIIH